MILLLEVGITVLLTGTAMLVLFLLRMGREKE